MHKSRAEGDKAIVLMLETKAPTLTSRNLIDRAQDMGPQLQSSTRSIFKKSKQLNSYYIHIYDQIMEE